MRLTVTVTLLRSIAQLSFGNSERRKPKVNRLIQIHRENGLPFRDILRVT